MANEKIYIQPKLSDTQQSAVDSGIDSTKVAQIATNSTNITTLQSDVAQIETKVTDTYTKEQTDEKLNTKQGKLTAGTNITITDDNVISATGGGSEPAAYIKEITKSGSTYKAIKKDGTDGESWTIPDTSTFATKTELEGETTRATNKENAIDSRLTVVEDTYATQYQLSQKVDRSVKDDQEATNTIDNQKGQSGCVMQTMLADGKTIISFNTASENGADGILGQVYAKDTTTGNGMRINFTKTGAYYGVGSSTPIDAAHEIAVKGDITGGGVEVINLSVKPTSPSASTGTITAEQWNKLKTGLNPIHLTVYGNAEGTLVAYYVDINHYWYNALRNEIGANVILNVGHASSSTQIANLQIREITETTPYTYDLTLTSEDFIYSEWIKSSEIDGKTIVKNSSTNKYETAIGGYMGRGLVPYDPYICYELALNQWATNPKVWFVTEQNYTMQVGDIVTAIILDQDTGNQWVISNATVAAYTIDGVEHIGVQYSSPKGGAKELYVLRWDIDSEEKVVVYNNDDKIVLNPGAILTAYKMVEGDVPVMINGKFIGIDGTTITYDSESNKLSAVQGVTREEFKFLEGVVEGKQDSISEDNKLSYNLLKDTPTIPSSTDFVKTSGEQTIAGVKTFSDGIIVDNWIKPSESHSSLELFSSQAIAAGSNLILHSASEGGSFQLKADNVSKSAILIGNADGTLTWNGKDIGSGAGYNIGEGLMLNTETNTLSNTAIVECYDYQQESPHANLWAVKDKNGRILNIKDIPDPYERARQVPYGALSDPEWLYKEFGEIHGSEKEVWIETGEDTGKYKIYQRSSTEVSATECQFYRCFIDGSTYKIEFAKLTCNESARTATWTVTTKTLA